MAKYDKPKAGEWVRPVRRGYRLGCCDCGSVHRIDFRLTPWGRGFKIWFRAFRLNRSTAAMRAAMRRKKMPCGGKKKPKRRGY